MMGTEAEEATEDTRSQSAAFLYLVYIRVYDRVFQRLRIWGHSSMQQGRYKVPAQRQ